MPNNLRGEEVRCNYHALTVTLWSEIFQGSNCSAIVQLVHKHATGTLHIPRQT